MSNDTKRLSDLFWLGIATAIFLPIGSLIALAILIDDGRPLFFTQARVGRYRRRFAVRKFRTMRDGRVTRVGMVLRKCGLDELPQFLNILHGDMSFVGPRPLTEDDVRRLGWTTARHDFRWRLAPGISGLAQIHAGRGARESLAWDRIYLRRRSLALDVRILGVTFLMNFLGKRRVQRALRGR